MHRYLSFPPASNARMPVGRQISAPSAIPFDNNAATRRETEMANRQISAPHSPINFDNNASWENMAHQENVTSQDNNVVAVLPQDIELELIRQLAGHTLDNNGV